MVEDFAQGTAKFGGTIDVNGTDEFNEEMDGMISRMWSFEGAITAAAAALGFMGAKATIGAVRAFANFEEQMAEVQKVTDPQTMRTMSTEIREMAREIPVAHDALTDLTAQAGRFGVNTRGGIEAMKDFVRTTAEMAEATTLNADSAGQAFARLSKQMDVSLDNIRNLGAVINKLSNNVAASANDITEAMLRSSAVLTQAGLTAPEISALSASISAVSSSSRRAGSRLRRLGQELMDPTTLQQIAENFNITVGQLRSIRRQAPLKLIKALATAMRDGGEAAFRLSGAFSTVSRQALAQLGNSMEQVNGSLQMANSQWKEATSLGREVRIAFGTLNAEWQMTKNLLHEIALEIGLFLAPAVTGLLEKINFAIESFEKINRATSGFIGTVMTLGTAIFGVVVAVASLIALFGGVEKWAARLRKGPWGKLLGFIGLMIVAIGLLASQFAEHMDTIQKKADEASDKVGGLADEFERLEDVVGRIGGKLNKVTGGAFMQFLDVAGEIAAVLLTAYAAMGLFSAAGAAATKLGLDVTFAGIASAAVSAATGIAILIGVALAVAAVIVIVKTLWEKNWANIQNIVAVAGQRIDKFISRLVSLVSMHLSKWQKNIDELTQGWQNAINNFREAHPLIDKAFSLIGKVIKGALKGIVWAFENWNEVMYTGFLVLFDALLGIVTGFVDFLLTFITSALELLNGDVDDALHEWKMFFVRNLRGINEFVEKWFGVNIKETLGNLWDDITSGVSNFIDNLVKDFENLWNDIISGVKSFVNDIIGNSIIPDMFKDIKNYVKNTGKNFLSNAFGSLLSGIKSKFKSWKKKLIGIVKDVISKAKEAIQLAKKATNINIGGNKNNNNNTNNGDYDLAVKAVTARRTGRRVSTNAASGSNVARMHQRQQIIDRSTSVEVGEINADSEEGGTAAARSLEEELASRNFDVS